MQTDETLLLPDENPQELADLEAAWTRDLPGQTFAIQTLRHDLILTDWLRRRARTIFHHLQRDLHSTGLPMTYWDRFTLHQFRFLQKHAAHTQQEFRKAFQLIHSFKPLPVKPEPPPPEPAEPKRDTRPAMPQVIQVSVVDGKTITEAEPDAHFFLRPDILEMVAGMWRQFLFKDGVVPPEYAYVLEHEGTYYGPAAHIFISYRTEHYQEICQREIASGSPHLLDGERWGYQNF